MSQACVIFNPIVDEHFVLMYLEENFKNIKKYLINMMDINRGEYKRYFKIKTYIKHDNYLIYPFYNKPKILTLYRNFYLE